MPKLKCMTTPRFQYWLEVDGFCSEHKEHIVGRIDKAIEIEVKKIAADYELEELGSIEETEPPQEDSGETVH